jgi:hypothetical protein
MSDDRIDKLEAKIDKVLDIAQEQAITLVRLTVSVEDHAKRSDTLEDLYNHLDEKIDTEVQPLKASVNRINGGWKVLIYIIVPLVAAVITTMHFIK